MKTIVKGYLIGNRGPKDCVRYTRSGSAVLNGVTGWSGLFQNKMGNNRGVL